MSYRVAKDLLNKIIEQLNLGLHADSPLGHLTLLRAQAIFNQVIPWVYQQPDQDTIIKLKISAVYQVWLKSVMGQELRGGGPESGPSYFLTIYSRSPGQITPLYQIWAKSIFCQELGGGGPQSGPSAFSTRYSFFLAKNTPLCQISAKSKSGPRPRLRRGHPRYDYRKERLNLRISSYLFKTCFLKLYRRR